MVERSARSSCFGGVCGFEFLDAETADIPRLPAVGVIDDTIIMTKNEWSLTAVTDR